MSGATAKILAEPFLVEFWCFLHQKILVHNNIAFLTPAFIRTLKSSIMSYTYQGAIYSVKSPIKSISVNKRNVAVTDQNGTKLLKFSNISDSKDFLAWIYQA